MTHSKGVAAAAILGGVGIRADGAEPCDSAGRMLREVEDWPNVVTPKDLAARLRVGGDRPDRTVRAWLRETFPEHVRYQRWEFTRAEAEDLVHRWHVERGRG